MENINERDRKKSKMRTKASKAPKAVKPMGAGAEVAAFEAEDLLYVDSLLKVPLKTKEILKPSPVGASGKGWFAAAGDPPPIYVPGPSHAPTPVTPNPIAPPHIYVPGPSHAPAPPPHPSGHDSDMHDA